MVPHPWIGWAVHITRMEEGRSAFKILTGKPKGRRPLGMPRRRWEDTIGVNVRGMAVNTDFWIDSTQDKAFYRTLVNVACS